MPNFEPTDEQWDKMKKHIKSDKYKKEDFFVFETLAVGDKVVPHRYIRIKPELLNIMKEDAQKGVSLMLNHNEGQLGVQSIPIGKVFDARIDGPSQIGETQTLYTTQYILKDDSKVDGYSKNDIIKLIETGILADTSIGWGTTTEAYKCSICGNPIYDWRKCNHIPGKKYIINEETNEVKQCIIEANPPTELHAGNNVLMENSIVFDGAYPNAIIQSATGEKKTNNGTLKALEKSEKMSVALSENDIIFGYSTNGSINLMYKESDKEGGLKYMALDDKENQNQETETTVETETVETETENTEEVVEEVTTETTDEATETEEVVETATEEVEAEAETTETVNEETVETQSEEVTTTFTDADILNRFDNICESVDELVMLAKEGLENRKQVIQSALDSGVHTMGNAFNKDIFTKTFSNMKTDDIKAMGEAWESQAVEKFEKEKVSKQDFSNSENEIERIDLTQFRTSNY